LGDRLGLVVARRERDPLDPGDNDVSLGVLRISSGLRASMRFGASPIGMFVDAGGAWHDERSSDAGLRADDQAGLYVGGGLEWWYAPFASLGPAVWHFEGLDDGLSETWIGLSFRFYSGAPSTPPNPLE
jgi:hypothetical protein